MRYIVLLFLILTNSALAGVDLVKVDKSESKMYLLDGVKVIKEYHVAFGANPKGHKQQEGDEKTPEGTYTLDYKKEDSAFYRAMHVSYPNAQDKARAKKRGVSRSQIPRWMNSWTWSKLVPRSKLNGRNYPYKLRKADA